MHTYLLVLQDLVCFEGQDFPLHRLYLCIVGEREWLDIPHPEHELQEPQEYKQFTGQQLELHVFVSLRW